VARVTTRDSNTESVIVIKRYCEGNPRSYNHFTVNMQSTKSIYLWLYGPVGPRPHFQFFLIFYTKGRTPLTGDRHVAKPLPTYRTPQT
jgi:hypothetical protein